MKHGNAESEWKTKICKGWKDQGYGYARRIEDMFGVGFPDMVLRPNGWPIVVIEAKMVTGRYFEPSPRQFVDLQLLHNPPVSFALVLGVIEKPEGVVFAFSEPMKKVDTLAQSTFFHVNFNNGLMMFLSRLKERYHVDKH